MKKKRHRWLQRFLDDIPNSVLRDDGLRVRVSYTNDFGKKKQFEQFVGVPLPDNFTELKDTSAAVLRELKETIKLKQAGAFGDFEKKKLTMTVGEFLKIWLAAVSPQLGTRTKYDYEKIIERHIDKSLGKVLLSRLDKMLIQSLCDKMIKSGIIRQTKYVKQILSTACNYAIEHGWRDDARNPCKLVKLPKKQHREIMAFDKNQARAFVKACRDFDNGIIFEFALFTGMRPEEYLALKWSDIDFENHVAQIRRKVVLTRTRLPVFEETKTKSSRRLIQLGEDLCERLEKHRVRQIAHIAKFKEYKNLKYRNYNLVFASVIGTPIGLQNLLRRFFKPILKKAGLENSGATIYSLRHTMATLLLLAGENAKVVQERLGHSSIVVTLDTYSHILPTMQAEASRKLTELLS